MNICIISPRYPYKGAMKSVFVEQNYLGNYNGTLAKWPQ